MTLNVASRFAETARRLADKPAVFDETGSATYGQLLGAAQAVAEQVRQATDREHVGLVAPTAAAFPVAYFGILFAGRVPVPLNFLLDAKTIAFMAHDAAFDTLVATRHFARLVDALGTTPLYVEDATAPPQAPLVPEAGDDDLATLLYTSGTTGLPKGVMLSHRNFVVNVESCLRHIGITEDDVFLGVLPFFHSFGITTSMLVPLLAGASAAFVARFSPQRVFETIQQHGVNVCFAVASMFRVLMRAGEQTGAQLGSLRFAIAGGEALGAPLATRFEEIFGIPLLEGYGLTETSPVLSVNLPERNRKGSAGRMLDWVEARIADDDGNALPDGADGELWVRGDCVARGYYQRPEETAAQFTPDGWFKTGDLARTDPDRYLWITGRKKDLIISAGENISPNEIESVLHRHPAVFEAAVIGVPDERRGEVPKAFVTLREGADATADDLLAFCRQHLPRYKVPAAIDLRPELPHSPTGKVHKLTLRQAEGLA